MSLSSLSRSSAGGNLISLALVGLLLAVAPIPALAQGKNTGTFMNQAVVRVTNIANKANNLSYGYNEGISILGGWLNEKSALTISTPLTAGVEYLFLAGGDQDATDVDLEILDESGNVVADDKGIAPEAIVPFTPRTSGKYAVRMSLYESRNKLPCVCVTTILKKNGWNVAVKNLDKATVNVMRALERADQIAQRGGRRVDLRIAKNQWAFYGGVLRQGENLSVNNLNLGTGDRMFFAAGDEFASILNLDLEDSNNLLVKQDRKNQAVSVIDYRPREGLHGLRAHNVQSRGAAVILMAVMDVYTPNR